MRKKTQWVEKAKAAARARDKAQRLLNHVYTKEGGYTLVELAAQELLGFRPGQNLVCIEGQAFGDEHLGLYQHWLVQEIYFYDDPERDVLQRSPDLTVRLVNSDGSSRLLSGKRADFRRSFKVV
jgi:hypothetical protein